MHALRHTFVALSLVAAVAGRVSAAPLFTLEDDGRTFLYRAHPGEPPGAVAEMFGVAPRDVPAFLAANGISDPTRVGAGFAYRIPNAAARALSDRLAVVETENARLTADARGVAATTQRLEREAADARSAAATAEAEAAHAARLQTLWPLVQLVLVLLVLGIGAAIFVAAAAINRERRAERYARALAVELEEKRRSALADRQESARRIIELEERTRNLEAQLGPRLLVGGRS